MNTTHSGRYQCYLAARTGLCQLCGASCIHAGNIDSGACRSRGAAEDCFFGVEGGMEKSDCRIVATPVGGCCNYPRARCENCSDSVPALRAQSLLQRQVDLLQCASTFSQLRGGLLLQVPLDPALSPVRGSGRSGSPGPVTRKDDSKFVSPMGEANLECTSPSRAGPHHPRRSMGCATSNSRSSCPWRSHCRGCPCIWIRHSCRMRHTD